MRDRGARPTPALSAAELEAALRDLGRAIAVPTATETGLDPAVRARIRIQAGDTRSAGPLARATRAWRGPVPSLRRAALVAAAAVLVVAALAEAIGFGLPGIRIVPAPSPAPTTPTPSAAPSASASPGGGGAGSGASTGADASSGPTVAPPASGILGEGLGLGDPIPVARVGSAVDIPVLLPARPDVGPPAAAWLLDHRISLVWATSPALPATANPGIGLILGEFRGSVDASLFEKIVGPDTVVTAVPVGGVMGYWISGAPHVIVFVDPNGQPVFDTRRIVGNTLLWARGDVTFRLESGLEQGAAVALAESLR